MTIDEPIKIEHVPILPEINMTGLWPIIQLSLEEFRDQFPDIEPDYDNQMNLWAGQIHLSRAIEGTKKMLKGLRDDY